LNEIGSVVMMETAYRPSACAFAPVDVVVPLYNNECFAVEAIQSALDQIYPIRKVIVVDDGSEDRSAAIVEEAFRAEPRVQVVRAAHGGLPYARNIGIRNSEAEFIAFLDSDDLWHPEKIVRQMDEFQSDEGVLLVSCGFHDIDEEGRRIPGKVHARHSGWVHDVLLGGNFLSGGSAAIVRRDVFERVGLFDERLSYAEDWDMWLRIAKVGPVTMMDADLFGIRRHGSQMSARGNRSKKIRVFKQHLAVWSKWTSEIEASPRAQAAVWRLIVSTALRAGSGVRSRLSVLGLGFRSVRKNLGEQVYWKLVWGWPVLLLLIVAEKIMPFRNSRHPS